jgi:dihydroorotase
MSMLIRGGRVLDPANGVDGALDVLVKDGRIERVGAGLRADQAAAVLEAAGKVVCPGFIDIHVHLREPGLEYKETVATGTRAAAAGGFTAVCCMANTQPVNDNRSITDYIRAKAETEGAVRVYAIGAVTRGLAGKELAELAELAEAGCVAFSDDGKCVMNASLYRRAMEYTLPFGVPIISHAEDEHLASGGAMHEGAVSTELGIPGVSAAAEDVMVARDLLLAELTGAHLHIAHLSTAGAVRLVREAKARGVLEAVVDGTIDCIATDHAPHAQSEKEGEFDHAAFGIVGLETAVSLLLDRLVRPGLLPLGTLVSRLSRDPARLLGLPGGSLTPGAPADLTLLDPAAEWTVDPGRFASKSRNTPFAGWTLTGRPWRTIVGGRIAWP